MDPTGAHIDSDTSIYAVFDFHLNIISDPETAWLKICENGKTNPKRSLCRAGRTLSLSR